MTKQILVLMSTFNGEKYLKTQLDSILAQEGVRVQILVRDDGSTDSTLSILRYYEKQGYLTYYTGPNLGPAKSFMDLIQHAGTADYYAFSDQDDYWFPQKLYRAITQLNGLEKIPALYYARPQLTDVQLHPICGNVYPYICTTFAQATIGVFATGCTMCFNAKLCSFLKRYMPAHLFMHDAWVFQVCLALGGKTFYDAIPTIYYRQHANNVLGGKTTFKKRCQRRWLNFTRSYSELVAEIVKGYGEYLPAENLVICKKILNYKKGCKQKWELLKDDTIRTGNKYLDRMYILKVLLGLF